MDEEMEDDTVSRPTITGDYVKTTILLPNTRRKRITRASRVLATREHPQMGLNEQVAPEAQPS
jgi:hypothetical protein